MSTDAIVTILGMALVTYATRAGGLWLAGRMHPTPRMERWLRQLPGTILVSLVAPAALTNGWADTIGVGATALVAYRTRSVLAAMIVGVAAVWALRRLT